MIENMIMWGVEEREWLNICWWIVGCFYVVVGGRELEDEARGLL
jgi:hypothetical protein